MGKIIQIIIFILMLAGSAQASSMFDKRISTGQYLFDVLVARGIPRDALNLTFQMFDYNQGRIPNTTYSVIVDYSLPSTMKRFYLMNFNTGQVEKYYVSHGIKSGVLQTRRFSNLSGSLKSSLGFFYAKGTYQSSKNGLSLLLDGIDDSNSNARQRAIVLHGAPYVSESFIYQNGRLGWSEGCFSVPPESVYRIIDLLKKGSIIFSYQQDLMDEAKDNPDYQNLAGRESIPFGVNTHKTRLEGGDDWFAIPPEFFERPFLASPLK